MSEEKKLIDIFDESAVADEIRHMVENPTIIEGSNAFYSHQALLTDEVSPGNVMCEWQVKGKPDVLIMSEKHAKALLSVSEMPLVENFMQYPTKDFERARSGEIALGMTKVYTPMVVVMQKQAVMDLIDPAVRHENETRALVERIQEIMEERGLSPSEFKSQLDRDYPKPDEPDEGLTHN